MVHPGVQAGAYGSDEDPDERARGLAAALCLVELVARHPEGQLWIILREEGSLLSPGCSAELDRYVAMSTRCGHAARVEMRTWAHWERAFPVDLRNADRIQ